MVRPSMLTEQEASPTTPDATLALLVETSTRRRSARRLSRERSASRNKARTTSYRLTGASRYILPKVVVEV